MRRRMVRVLCVLAACLSVAAQSSRKPRELRPGFNLFSKQQDVELGREAASQVERQLPLVTSGAVPQFVERIGRKLASAPEAQANDYPYTFKVVQEKSINAFALPGGPTFTHTGLITAAENEAQVAGVLAHEISHVVLRHGTGNVTRANLIQLPALIAGQMAGGGWGGMLAQLGIGLGANSVMLKMSRNAERDADLLGTRIMSRVGYNPLEMARFFEKLEAEAGKGSALSQFFSDHPNPGNRVKSVQDEILLLAKRNYDADPGDLARVKQTIQQLPAPARKPQQASPGQGAGDARNAAPARPSQRLRDYQGREATFQYPENWEILGQDRNSGEITIAPRAGLFQNGIGYGALVNLVAARQRVELVRDTDELVRSFQQRDSNLRVLRQPRSFDLNGNDALATRLEGPSPFEGTKEALILITVARPRGLFYMLLIAPESDLTQAQPAFDQMINSIRFSN